MAGSFRLPHARMGGKNKRRLVDWVVIGFRLPPFSMNREPPVDRPTPETGACFILS
jgi:hypothetical protein